MGAVCATLTSPIGTASAEDTSVAAVESAGCSNEAPTPGQTDLAFAGSSKTGRYILNVPTGASDALPLVIDLHGLLESKEITHEGAKFGELGDREGFYTVTPQLDRFGPSQWDFGPGSGDIGWVSELLTHVESTLCVDQRRVYVSGLSMGAFATSSIGCQLADRVAAIAPVAGLRDFSWCAPTRPVPVVAFHGTADNIVPYDGGPGTGSAGPSSILENTLLSTKPVADAARSWADRNGCTGDPQRENVADDVVVYRYTCPAGGDVELYAVVGGGHIWPGTTSTIYPEAIVGPNTHSIDATALIWDFFRAHPMAT